MAKLLFFHNNFILGGDTFYLAKVLKRLSPDDFVLIYGSSEPVTKYIGSLGLKPSSLVNFNSYCGQYFDNSINNAKAVIRLPLRLLIRLLRPFLAVLLLIRLKMRLSSIDSRQFNRIVINAGSFDGSLCSQMFLKLIGRKCTYILHNHIPGDIISYPDKFIAIARHVDEWIVGSKVIKEQLIGGCGVPEERIHFIPYGMDPSVILSGIDCSAVRRKLGVSEKTYLILHPSVFEKRKGHYYTISAFRDFNNKVTDSRLVLAGSGGADERDIRKMINELGIENAVIFTGFYSPVEELIRTCDLLCLPSQEYDTTSFVILLALACGTPVLTTQRRDFDGFLKDEYNALLVEKGDYKMITDKILRLFKDNSLRDTLIKNGLTAHHDYFSEERMAGDTISLLMSNNRGN